MKLAKSLITVTPFSKLLAMFLFIIFPFIGFCLGIFYQKSLSPVLNNTPLSYPNETSTSAQGLYNVSIFIKERTSDETLNKLTEDLKSLKGVKSVNVITKEKNRIWTHIKYNAEFWVGMKEDIKLLILFHTGIHNFKRHLYTYKRKQYVLTSCSTIKYNS